MRRLTVLPTLLAVLTSGACGGGRAPEPPDDRVVVQAGQAQVRAEVADDEAERAVGLMRRESVPVGTGMVFRYDRPVVARYYMYDVSVPLTAVFARDGAVVGVIDMPPCGESQPSACPTYGPDEEFDTVLEAAPETLRGQVREGDRLTVQGG